MSRGILPRHFKVLKVDDDGFFRGYTVFPWLYDFGFFVFISVGESA